MSLAITGLPHASASTTGKPKPSASLGIITTAALAVQTGDRSSLLARELNDAILQPKPRDERPMLGRPFAPDLHEAELGMIAPNAFEDLERDVETLARDAASDVEEVGASCSKRF